jgi:hypothetical protein
MLKIWIKYEFIVRKNKIAKHQKVYKPVNIVYSNIKIQEN